MGVPSRVANTSPLSSHSPASFILSSSWALRCFFKDLFATSGSFVDRLPLAVFGGLKENPLPARVDSVRRTCSVPPAKSTSSHLRPKSSPCLIPVVTASMYSASSLSPSAASSSARACWGERLYLLLLWLGSLHRLCYVARDEPVHNSLLKGLV